jgi:hypothetical protein
MPAKMSRSGAMRAGKRMEVGMRIVAVSILVGSLALIGAAPVSAAGRSVFATGPGTSMRVSAGDDSTGDRDTYRRKAHDSVSEWQRKLRDFGKKVSAAGNETSKSAQSDMNAAWDKTEAASRQLETAGDQGWNSAKTAFEKASNDLADTWHRNVPDDK